MKVAILVDVPSKFIGEFLQSVDGILHGLGGRMIYNVRSKYPIRLVCAEKDMTHPGISPDAVPRLGVKNATGYERRNMDDDYHFGGNSDDRGSRVVPNVLGFAYGLRQRNNEPDSSDSRCVGSHFADGGNSSVVRRSVPSGWIGRWWTRTKAEVAMTSPPWITPRRINLFL